MKLDDLFEKNHLLPTIPKVVQELIDSFGRENIDIGEIARKVSLDQVLSAKVLRLANSSYYGLPRQVGSVDEAIKVMGFNSLRTLVIASGVSGVFVAMPGLNRKVFWKKTLLVGNYAKWLARQVNANPEMSFTAGLMHAIGQLLMHITLPKESARIVKAVAAGGRRVVVEEAEIGVNHCEIGAELARRWNFPEAIQFAIHHYDDPLQSSPFSVLAGLVYIAVFLVDAQLNKDSLQALSDRFPQELAVRLGLDMGKVLETLPNIEDMTTGLDAFLSE